MKKYLTIMVLLPVLLLLSAAVVNAQSTAQSVKELKQLIKNERFGEAVSKANSWIARKPKEPAAYYYYGAALIGEAKLDTSLTQKNLDSAKILFEKGIQADDDYALNYAGLSRICLLRNDIAGGQTNFNTAYDKDDEDLDVLIELGKVAAVSPNNLGTKGIDILKKAKDIADKKKKREEKVDIYLTLGDIYKSQNSTSEAVQNYNEAKNINPNLQYPYLMQAEIYANVNKDQAVQLYKSAIEKDSSDPAAYRALANLYYGSKQYDLAAQYWNLYIEKSGNTSFKQQRLASIYFLNKDYNKSIDILNNLINTDPKDAVSLRLLSSIYLNSGDSVKAAATYDRYLKVQDPAKITSGDYQNYGSVLFKMGNSSLAVEMYQKAFNLDSTKTDLLSDMSDIYFKEKNFKAVIKVLENKYTVKPEDFTVKDYVNLGIAHYVDTSYVAGQRVFQKLTEEKPAFLTGWFWLARTNAAIDPEQTKGLAEGPYKKIVEIVTTDPANQSSITKNKKELVEAYVYLGFLSLNKDMKDVAKDYFTKASVLDPENQQVKDGLSAVAPQKGTKKKNGK